MKNNLFKKVLGKYELYATGTTGTLIMVLFCNYKFGWSFEKFQEEANTGKGAKVAGWMKYYFRYVLPIIIGVILVYGIITPFI